MVIGGAAQVLVLGQVERALRVLLPQVDAILEDGRHAFPAGGAVLEGACAGRLQPADSVLLHPQHGPKASARAVSV